MKYLKHDIVFQEVPGEVTLALSITGCPLRCLGCHSPELWSPQNGTELTTEVFEGLLQRYKCGLTCVLFMGGEWDPENLVSFLKIAKAYYLKTGLYTGRELSEINPEVLNLLDLVKTGPWRQELGGLDSPTTNQKMHHLTEESCL